MVRFFPNPGSFSHLDQGSLRESGGGTLVPPTIYSVFSTMIRSSDAAIARGSKAPNQANDELAFIRVPPGLPCMRTSRA
jgi:hypothetical protein